MAISKSGKKSVDVLPVQSHYAKWLVGSTPAQLDHQPYIG
jgi:hypothetical protein